jgi:hypothetical protein
VARENILDVAGTMQYTDNFNRARGSTVEYDVSAEGKTPHPRSQLLASASRAGLAAHQLERLVKFVDKRVGVCHAVIRNVTPNFDQIRACARADAEMGTYFAFLADFFSRAARLIFCGSNTVEGPLSKPSRMSWRSFCIFRVRS